VGWVKNGLSWSSGHGRLRCLIADSKSVGMGAVRLAESMDLRAIAQNLRITKAEVSSGRILAIIYPNHRHSSVAFLKASRARDSMTGS
jgi:hypothetical protein